MKQITIRGVDDRLDAVLKREAQRRSKSVNGTILEILRTAVGLGRSAAAVEQFHDLDALAGTWTASDSRAFERALAEQRQIDDSLWQ